MVIATCLGQGLIDLISDMENITFVVWYDRIKAYKLRTGSYLVTFAKWLKTWTRVLKSTLKYEHGSENLDTSVEIYIEIWTRISCI